MTKGQLERFAGFILHKYMPRSASDARYDMACGNLDKKEKELGIMITDVATGVDPHDLDKILNDTTQKLKEAYRFYSS